MSSYWDYLLKDLKNPIATGPAAFLHAAYDALYDSSHGSDRYYLSKVPLLGLNRKWRDAAQQSEDQYNNTGTDPAYSTRLLGPGFESLYGAVGGGVGVVRMANSLAALYTPEVVEDVSRKFNNMYQ